MTLSERVALVTGAGSSTGIGFATARLLAEKGARVAITSTTGRIEDRAKELVATVSRSSRRRPTSPAANKLNLSWMKSSGTTGALTSS